MNLQDTGRFISKLRKEAGYTQKTLADALFVSDKAVSKWERGICMPDSSLLPKLSMLLDSDIEYLITGSNPYGHTGWVGEIRIDNLKQTIAGRPILIYIISYFMLAGISKIHIKTVDTDFVKSLNLHRFGLNISFSSPTNDKVMIIYKPFFLFGNNLTRYLQLFLFCNKNIIPTLYGKDIPIIFSLNSTLPLCWHEKNCERKPLGRGMIFWPLNNDSENFIEMYEKYSELRISDLNEIAKNRGLI